MRPTGDAVTERPQDRRKYARLDTDQLISFAPLEQRDQMALVRDVSLGGIRFQAIGCEIELDDVLRVTFNVGDHTVDAVGKVAWVTELDPLTSDIGLQFLEIDPLSVRLIEEALET